MNDLISRQAAIDLLERKKDKNAKGDIAGFYNKIIQNDIDTLMQLPSAQPEAVEAIPVEWIEKHIKELQESFASFTGWPVIENMLMKWKEEQK